MALTDDQNRDLTQVFQDRLLAGERFETIVQARRVASEVLGEPVPPGTAIAKKTEEIIEQGLVRAAKHLIQQGKAEGRSPVETFEQLTDLYQRQPRLGTRSSTSVLRQQYSTPLPLAYLGSQLAGIDVDTTVYEPTAGHGALLLESDPEKATVNEIDDNRAADLRRQGYQVTQQDATGYGPAPRSQDVVIANPPFGRRRKEGRAEQFVIGGDTTQIRTSQLDHVIVWNALESMKDDGRAVLLIGGEKGSEAYRSDEYNTQQNRGFYYNLYRYYNVTEHFTVDGSLYSRQGAGFPVDVILISGRGASERALPAADVPQIYESYDKLKEVFDHAVFRESPGLGTPSNRATGRNVDATRQFLRGDRPREQNRDPELRGLQVPAESSGDLDDSPVGRGAGDVTGRGLSDDSPALDQRSGTGFSPSPFRSGVARELRHRAGRQSVAADSMGGSRTGDLSTADGARPGESELGRRNHSTSNPRRVALALHEAGIALAPDAAHNSAVSKEVAMVDEHQHQSGQVPYVPRSQGPRLDTLIPRNISSAVQSALDRLEGRVGDIDPFVARKLNYPSVGAMHEVLAAEQVDGVALGIDNIEHGNGALVGDQTGVGKGRQMAAMLRYAKETDRTPVFITRDVSLYADMIRDLDDIGVKDFKPFLTNSKETLPLPDGRTLKTTAKVHAAELNRLIQQGGLASEDGYDGVFTTYSQLQTVKGHSTPRREFLNLIAPQSIIVMDEAHEAGGSLQPEAWGHSGPPNRAEFARQLVDQADGVVFSSATAIKRPDVMDLYGRRSGMREALGSVESLQQALDVGGIPLQQTCTNMLSQDGFYIRRERSYEGVDFSLQTVPVDRESTDNLSRIMGQILQFDVAKQDALKGLDKELKASAKKVGLDTSTGLAGASSTNFTAIMHNVLDQSLLARKADQMADAAISSLERGEKPILTVSNTMGSFLESYAADADIKVGEAFDGNFSDVLMRYLERSRDVIERDFDGTITRSRLGDAELGPEAVAAFNAAKELIQETDLDLPISPIDHIKQRVEAAGYTFGEITGRNARLEYDGEGHATYQRRSTYETSKAGKVRVTDSFNSGKTDVLLLNRSGATGISLHASSKFADQHRRHMIVGQPERNITDFMQTLGRAHRTGQVVPPRITLLMGDTPDEKRPAAVLKQKMASLNANTTADRNAGFDTDAIPDFFNIYGSAVVEQLLAEYPEINQRLDYPITVSEEGADSLEDVQADAIAKVTGRLPLLTVAEQETFYELLEQEYTAFVEQQEALGNSVLEAEAVDLDARTLAQAEVMTPQSGVTSAFGAGVQAEVVDVKAQSHPKTQLEVVNEVRENLHLEPVTSVEDHDAEAIDHLSQDYARGLLEKAEQVAGQYLAQQTAKLGQHIGDPEKLQTALNKETRRLDKQKTELTKLHRYRLGQTVRLATDNGRIFYGAITQVGKRGRSLDALLEDGQSSQGKEGFGDANPVVASKWEVRVSLADASNREIPIPLSKLNTDRMGAVEVTPVTQTLMGKDIMSQFDEQQTGQREVRQVLRGNLFRAAEKYGSQGHVINATVAGGSIEPMMMLPRGYNIQQELSESPVELPAARNVRQFFEITHREGIIKTSDEQITLKAAENSGEYFLETGKKQKDVYLDQNLIEAVGSEFYTVSDRFQAVIDGDDRLEAVVSYIQQGRNQRLEAVTHLDQARELVGEKIPEFSWSDSVEAVIERAGLPPAVDMSNLGTVRDRLDTLFQQDAVVIEEPVSVPSSEDLPETESVEAEQSEPQFTDEELDRPESVESEKPAEPEPVQPVEERGDLAEQVESVKSAVEDGARPSFTVEMPGRGDRPSRSLKMVVSNPNQIRFNEENGTVAIASATDLNRFFEAPKFEAEAAEALGLHSIDSEKGVNEADRLNEAQSETSAYRLDSEGPTTIGRERARLMNVYSEADSTASEQGVERANAIAARDDELEALAEAYGEDAGISFTHPAEQDAAIAARDIRYRGQPEAGETTLEDDTFAAIAERPVGFNDDWSLLFYRGESGINSLSITEPERDGITDALLTLHDYDALNAQLKSILEGAVPPSQIASAAEAIIADQAPTISGREVALSASDEPTSEKESVSQTRQAHSLGRVAHFAAAADAEKVTDDLIRAEERAQSAMPEPQYVTSAYDRALGLPQGKLTDSIHTIISYRQPGFSPLVHRAIDQYLPDLIQTQMSVEDALTVQRTYDGDARQNSFEDTATGDLKRIAWNRAIEVLSDAVVSNGEADSNQARQIQRAARVAEKIGAVDYPIGFEPQRAQAVRSSEAEPPSLPELFARADALAAQPLYQEPASTTTVEAQSTETQPAFDYRHTLERLREDTQGLPEPLRDSILNAIQEAEAQMSEESQLPADASLEKVSAGDLVQAAIAQNEPDLQDQMLNAEGTGIPSVEEFRDWYRKASVMDRSATVLSQIEHVGRQAKAGTLEVDGFDPAAMRADLAEYDQQASLAADIMPNVCRFLDEAVKAGVAMQSENGTVAEGRHYRVMAKAGMVSVENKETSGKLSFTEHGIVEVSDLDEADKSRWERLGALDAARLTTLLAKQSPQVQSELA